LWTQTEPPAKGFARQDRRLTIASDKLRRPIDYRLTASSRNGRWRIISFVAGD